MKRICALTLAVTLIIALCAPLAFGMFIPPGPGPVPVADPDNTMTGNPEKSGGVNMGSGNTDMNKFNSSNGINDPLNGTPGNSPGTKLFGTFPKSGD